MKKFNVAAFFFGFIAFSHCYTDEEMAMYKEMMSSCIKQTGIAEDVVMKIENEGVYEEDPKLPEYAFCMMKKSEFMNDNGDYLIDSMREILTEEVGADVAKQAMDVCTKFTGDKLTKAIELSKCLVKEAYHE